VLFRSNIFFKILYFIKKVNKIRKIKREYNIDVSISLLKGANLINVLSKQKEIILTSERNMISSYGTGPIKKIIQRFISNSSNKVIALSEGVKYDLVNMFHIQSSKIITIYNPIDLEYIKNNQNEEVMDYTFIKENIYIINIGRLTTQKGQINLLKSFKILISKYENLRLLILGDGELRNDLKNFIINEKLDNTVTLLGFKSNPFPYLNNSNIFVLSSLYEGFGNVLLEAMACKLPIISTDCFSGPREIISPNSDFLEQTCKYEFCEYGVLTKPFINNDDSSKTINSEHYYLAEVIEKMINDDELLKLYQKKSFERSNDFELKVIINDWIKLIEGFNI